MGNFKQNFKFVNQAGTWMSDLIEWNDSQYIDNQSVKGYFYISYNPSNHLIFLQFLKTKTSQNTLDCLQNQLKYLKDNKDKIINTQFNEIKFDEGNEFKREFLELLRQNNINIKVIASHQKSYNSLAPVNSMCNVFRRYLIKNIIDQTEFVNENIMNRICKKFMKFQNFENVIKFCKKTPDQITLEDITFHNEDNQDYNDVMNQKHLYNIGDKVRIQLFKRDKLDKGRHQKWSDGTYQVYDIQGVDCYVYPLHFNIDDYCSYFKVSHNSVVGLPLFIRKSYELKDDLEDSEKYFVAENDMSQYYTFDKIILKNGTKYVIKSKFGQFEVKQNMLRCNEQDKKSFAELQFEFPQLYKNINRNLFLKIQDSYLKR